MTAVIKKKKKQKKITKKNCRGSIAYANTYYVKRHRFHIGYVDRGLRNLCGHNINISIHELFVLGLDDIYV
jgi:hypothetical protein